jgi:hypothetical protein
MLKDNFNMKEQIIHQLKVKKPLEFCDNLIDILPDNTLLSFEGKLNGILNPKHLYSNKEIGLLMRNTKTPKQDFWVFQFNPVTRDYLKSEFIGYIGIHTNVIHMLAEYNHTLVFTSYDNFNEDCVSIVQTNEITKEKIDQLIGLRS